MNTAKIHNKHSSLNHVNRYLSSLEPHTRSILLKIRTIVFGVNSFIQEDIQWGSILFKYEHDLIGFKVTKSCVRMIFLKGNELKDPTEILQPYGSKYRSLKFKAVNEINDEAITQLIKESVQVDKLDNKMVSAY